MINYQVKPRISNAIINIGVESKVMKTISDNKSVYSFMSPEGDIFMVVAFKSPVVNGYYNINVDDMHLITCPGDKERNLTKYSNI